MAFTIQEMSDLTRLLAEHPEWRDELRRLVLTDELLSLPEIVRKLAERMDQLTERMDQLTERMDQLTERMDQLTERMDQLAERMDQLTERMDQLTERMDQLAQRMDQLTERTDQLAQRIDTLTNTVNTLATHVETLLISHQRMVDDIGAMKGKMLEMEYRDRATAYFGRLLRKGRVVDTAEVWDSLESVLDQRELDDALLADLFMSGVVRGSAEANEVFLVIELSFVVDRSGVGRAHRRAELLRRAGYPAVGVAAGEHVTLGAREAALDEGVALVERLEPIFWGEALGGLAA